MPYESQPSELPTPPTPLRIRTGLRAGAALPLGDAVAWFTHTTGLDKLADFYTEVTGKDCGCDERRQVLNNLIQI